ncbi:MAG: hypothetical protein CO182_01715 [Lysobacterales bacterium CG_4_9_14_3_um_filter_62_6]|nr:MAG: hypothetical protein CO182_01715 [Xanthomonadales bacterium CG_4_9_14_3_um_filter_62_6]
MSSTAADLELQKLLERLHELEARFAFQDEIIQVLNPQVAALDRRVLQSEAQLRALRQDLSALRDALGHDVRSEAPPPHF